MDQGTLNKIPMLIFNSVSCLPLDFVRLSVICHPHRFVTRPGPTRGDSKTTVGPMNDSRTQLPMAEVEVAVRRRPPYKEANTHMRVHVVQLVIRIRPSHVSYARHRADERE